MAKAKTLYLHGENETTKDGVVREAKILRVQKKLQKNNPKLITQSSAVRHMIDEYKE